MEVTHRRFYHPCPLWGAEVGGCRRRLKECVCLVRARFFSLTAGKREASKFGVLCCEIRSFYFFFFFFFYGSDIQDAELFGELVSAPWCFWEFLSKVDWGLRWRGNRGRDGGRGGPCVLQGWANAGCALWVDAETQLAARPFAYSLSWMLCGQNCSILWR